MIDPKQFRAHIVARVLQAIGLWSQAAENLLVGTAIAESMLTFLVQTGGPALGLYQIEPATHRDVLTNFLAFRTDLYNKIKLLQSEYDLDQQLIWNVGYATAIARVLYYRHPDPLPDASDIDGLSNYYKSVYNTSLGAGSADRWATMYRQYGSN